ncbi:MAG: hypothetical protein HW408_1724 [Actinobacteria bacterium]|nr:hypothetical protein [Actinomycetota bacterium]
MIEIYFVSQGSGWAGKTVGDLPAGNDTGIVLLAVLREDRAILQPAPSTILSAGDKVVLFGGHAPLAAALSKLAHTPH